MSVKFFIKPVIYVFLLFIPSIVKFTGKERLSNLHLRGWQIFAIVALVAALNHFVAGWAQGQGLDFRGQALTLWMMGAVWTFLWIFCYNGKLTHESQAKIYSFKWPLLIISLLVSSNFIGGIHDVSIAKEYRAEYDNVISVTQKQIAEGKKDIFIPTSRTTPKILPKLMQKPNPQNIHFNTEFAKFYHVDSVTALPQEILDNPESMTRWENGDMQDLLKFAETNQFLALQVAEIYDANFPAMNNIPRDNDKAVYWYTKAAEMGNLQARRRLVKLYVLQDKTPGINKYINAGLWYLRSELPLLLP